MRKLGIFLTVIGLIQTIVLIINQANNGIDIEFLITASSFIVLGVALFLIGNHKKKAALKAGKSIKKWAGSKQSEHSLL